MHNMEKRKLKRRLLGFRQYLLENYCLNTDKKSEITTKPVTFKDLLDKRIRNAIKISNTTMTAVILLWHL